MIMTGLRHYQRLDLSKPIPRKAKPSVWGCWKLHPDGLALLLDNGVYTYQVELERFDSSASMLDTIMQMTSKPRISDDDVGWFVQALSDIFHPQGSLCSSGVDKRIDDVNAFLRARVN